MEKYCCINCKFFGCDHYCKHEKALMRINQVTGKKYFYTMIQMRNNIGDKKCDLFVPRDKPLSLINRIVYFLA